MRCAVLIIFLLSVAIGCKKDKLHTDTPAPPVSPPDLITIKWDASERVISHDVPKANYARVHRINGDTLFLVYRSGQREGHNNIALRKSFDNGKTWEPVQIIVPDNNPHYYGFGGGELLVLDNSWIILAYEGRGKPDNNENDNIQIRISKDRGKNWGEPIIVAKGRSWEPAMIQLPNGEIELFYSSEAQWWPSPEPRPQEILMVRSLDNGQTWTEPQTVAYSEGKRDGMPVPLLLKGNKGIVFSIEGVGRAKSPWIIYSSLKQDWNYSDLPTINNERRWLATTENIFGGAPYLVQLPTGETILSCHIAGGRNIPKWRFSTMAVFIGDDMAKNFHGKSYPWPHLPIDEGRITNSLFVKDSNTIVAIACATHKGTANSEILWKEGHIIR